MLIPAYCRFILSLCFLLSLGDANANNYIKYYRAIAAAETEVVNGQYTEAILQYSKAFAEYPYNNPTDCYVAAQVAAYAGDSANCYSFLRTGISFGLPLQTIQHNKHLAVYALPKEELSMLQRIYEERINKTVRAAMIRLIQKDQAVVHKLPPGALYDNGERSLKAIYQPTWDSMVNEIIQLTTIYGFPAQKIAGTQNGDDTVFRISPHCNYAYFILIHYCNAWQRMGTVLHDELEKGNITPIMYAALADNSNGYNDYAHAQYFSPRPCNDNACKKQVNKHLQEVNAARQEIGLCSYDVMEKKFASTIAYRKWQQKAGAPPVAVFDFHADLHFY